MTAYFLKRFALLFLTLFGVTFVSFMMIQMAPGSPLEMKLARDKSGGLGDSSAITEEGREQLKKLYHLDKPILTRYYLWISDLARLELGRSFTDHRPVIEKIKETIPVSITFGLSSILFSLMVGIPLGMWGGVRHGLPSDRVITFLSIGMTALPSYVLGLLLLTFFGGGEFLNWFPIYGIQSDEYENLSTIGAFLDRAHHFILPCLCYSIGGIAFITQQQRASILETLNQDYIRTARSKGLSEGKVIFKHAFRNSLIPIVTIAGGMIPGILGASVIVERVFSIPGIGLLSYNAIFQRDYPTIMATFTISAFLALIGIFVSDILYVLVDPRIDFEGR